MQSSRTISDILPKKDHGFIVADGEFERLKMGDEIRYIEKFDKALPTGQP